MAVRIAALFQRKFLGENTFALGQISACATGDLFLIMRSPRAANLGARFDFYGKAEEKNCLSQGEEARRA